MGAIITLRKSVLVPDLTSNFRPALMAAREEHQRSQKKLSSIGRQGGEDISEETLRFQCVVREKLGNIVGYSSTVQSEAARCIQAIGREALGGLVAKDFIARVDEHEHERVKNIVKASPLETVLYMNNVLFMTRYQDNCKHVKSIVETCVKEYAAKAKAVKVDMPNELRRREGELKRMEDNVNDYRGSLNQFKQGMAERCANLVEFGVKVVSVETVSSADYNQSKELCELSQAKIRDGDKWGNNE